MALGWSDSLNPGSLPMAVRPAIRIKAKMEAEGSRWVLRIKRELLYTYYQEFVIRSRTLDIIILIIDSKILIHMHCVYAIQVC